MRIASAEYFLAVVEYGSFSKAAVSLGVSQAAVSQAIGALEAELGHRVFHRSSGGVRLSSAGQALRGPMMRLARDLERLLDASSELDGSKLGSISIACPADLADSCLDLCVGRFRREAQGSSVSISDARNSSVAEEAARTGQVDFAVSTLEASSAGLFGIRGPDLKMWAVFHESRWPGDTVQLSDVLEEGIVSTATPNTVRLLLESVAGEAAVAAGVRVETDILEAHEALVLAGTGVMTRLSSQPRHAIHSSLRYSRIEGVEDVQLYLRFRESELSLSGERFADLWQDVK